MVRDGNHTLCKGSSLWLLFGLFERAEVFVEKEARVGVVKGVVRIEGVVDEDGARFGECRPLVFAVASGDAADVGGVFFGAVVERDSTYLEVEPVKFATHDKEIVGKVVRDQVVGML